MSVPSLAVDPPRTGSSFVPKRAPVSLAGQKSI